MSGQLVGEVLAASDQLRERGLSERGFHALVAIAEKALTDTRQGSVRWDHIRASLYGASLRTAERAVQDLKRAGIVAVVRPGFNNNHGRACAPVYEIQTLTDTDIHTAESLDFDTDIYVAGSMAGDSDKPGGRSRQNLNRSRRSGVGLDGSIDGSLDGGRALDDDEPPPRYCEEHHPNGTGKSCTACMLQGRKLKAWRAEREARERAMRDERRRAREQCPRCGGTGQIETADDEVGWCPGCSSWKAKP